MIFYKKAIKLQQDAFVIKYNQRPTLIKAICQKKIENHITLNCYVSKYVSNFAKIRTFLNSK